MRSARILASTRCLVSSLHAQQQVCAGACAAKDLQLSEPSCSPRCGINARSEAVSLRQLRSVQGFARIAETEEGMTKVSGYYAGGFYLNNVQVPGSVILSHDLYMMWRPRRISEVTPDSLVFLELLKPAPEVLVLGTGATSQPLPGPLREYLARLGVRVELLDSRNASGYFNVLNDEGRAVVGALLVCDPEARMPENLPEANEPLWDRPGLMQRSGSI
ncbi:hypothetical protein Agub_g4679 [Astrephomene gubernaculifera]|uniref:NADH dehydrogenase [ubiquinone] 1 alpha subcomplex assembly factor 3 n=1 Tax=Astrephomene gubernaculifera TaxID=47775 RepID=A0AAD3HJY6_9CHLO|nr:hypothetical protein Agub_g4679 [Astrephomene gubernaculifera]